MNLVKWGIASVVVACTAAVACGGSSSSSGNGSGAGTSNSSAGSSSSSGGSSSATGGSSSGNSGGSSSHAGSTSTGGTGGLSCNPMMPGMGGMGATCPALTNCLESKCKAQIDACQSGACADYSKCTTPCNCDQTCIDKCTQSTACMDCATAAGNCVFSNCFNEALSCGSGSGGTGAGGTFSLDAGTQTCADLTTCCATISDAQQKSACQMVVDQKIDLICGLAYASFCP